MEEKMIQRIYEILSCEAAEVNALSKSIDNNQLLKLIDAISECKGKVITTGCGTSGVAAGKIAHTLCCIDNPALFLPPAEALHGGLGVAQKEDIIILVSKGGNSTEIDSILESCKKKGVFSVAVTENPDTYLAQNSDLKLIIKVEKEPDKFNMLATSSTLAVIAVFDAISIILAEHKGYTKEQFLCNHPGGDVGMRLVNQVKHNTL